MGLKITADNIETTTLQTIAGPKIASIGYPNNDTALDISGGQSLTVNGSGFASGATVFVDGTAAPSVTFISSSVLVVNTPARAAGTYQLYVVNPDGATTTFVPGVQYSGVPNWSNIAGSLGSIYELDSFSATLTATSDSTVTYSISSGLLPPSITLNANTGHISGSAAATANPTTYNFTVDANDQENQNTTRNFSITVNPDVVTWITPANDITFVELTGNSISQSLSATSAAGRDITYSANILPNGVSIVGSNISGTYSAAGNITSLITATAATTLRTAARIVNFVISNLVINTEILVVAGGGGGGATLGGGGGAGGLLLENVNLSAGITYTVVVGGGGSGTVSAGGANPPTSVGTNGGNSTVSGSDITTINAIGGGLGGYYTSLSGQTNGADGGSGGGAGGGGGGQGRSGGIGTAGPPRQGYNGGNNWAQDGAGAAGGGGGAGGAGASATPNTGGNGGIGVQTSISGTATYYAGGGGGAAANYGTGGLGGGGAAGATGTSGTANTGGGGGGGGSSGGSGGSGVVIIRYPNSFKNPSLVTGNPTFINSGGYKIYTFTSSGSITF